MNTLATRSICALALAAASLFSACGDDGVPAVGEKPVVVLSAPTEADAGEEVWVDARSSTDADGFVVEFVFDWGDGTAVEVSADGEATHVYTFGGSYTLTVAVVDDRGNKSTAEAVIVVDGEAAPDDGSGSTDGSGTVDGSGDSTDPNEGSANEGSGTTDPTPLPTPDP